MGTWVEQWHHSDKSRPPFDRGAESSSPVTSRHVLCSLFVRLICSAVVYLIPGCQTHPVLPRCTPRSSRFPGPTVLSCGFSKPPPSALGHLSGAWLSIAYHNCLASHAVNGARGSCSSERSADLFSTVMPWRIIVMMQADAFKQPSPTRLLMTRRRSAIAMALTGFGRCRPSCGSLAKSAHRPVLVLLPLIASAYLGALCFAATINNEEQQKSFLPPHWWESASAIRNVSLKDDTPYPQLSLDPAKAKSQLEAIKKQGFAGIQVFGPADGGKSYNGLDTRDHFRIEPKYRTVADFAHLVRVESHSCAARDLMTSRRRPEKSRVIFFGSLAHGFTGCKILASR